MTSLSKGLGLAKKGVISLVGAGGKTSLMFRLARELAASRGPVLTTTTTKIFPPTEDQSPAPIVNSSAAAMLGEARDRVKRHGYVTAAAAFDAERGKLIGYAPEAIERIAAADLFRWVIVEADGAAGKPLKAPADHEPVLPASTGWVIGVVGLSVMGQPLAARFVFRPERFSRVTGLAMGEPVSAAALSALITHPQGLFKGAPAGAEKIVFLNQADLPDRSQVGTAVDALLSEDPENTVSRLIVGSTVLEPPILDIYERNHHAT